MPRGLPASLPVRHGLVAPDVVDGVELPQLGEQPRVRDVRPHVGPELDALGPVVAPVVHGARLQRIRSTGRRNINNLMSTIICLKR